MTSAELSEKTIQVSSATWRWIYDHFFNPRMSPFLFFLDFAVYPPIILVMIFLGLRGHTALPSTTLVISGLAIWTFVEYLFHRFVLHRVEYFSKMHFEHHDEEMELIGTPTLMSLTLLIGLVFLPLYFITSDHIALCLMAGFLIGYIAYVWVHFAVHHKGSGGWKFMRKLKRQHAVHHHGTSETNFGVTTDLWDRFFRTKETKISTAVRYPSS
jgi:sterol desaturase/sphingolipid hydroxylase (fatty acid hydroxylase superfamily)